MNDFTDEELLAYADERLESGRSVQIEQTLRMDTAFANRMASLLNARDQGGTTVGELWRRERLSCPPRAVWEAFLDGRLGDGLSQYLKFHVETIGCRICAANLSDLSVPGSSADAERRAGKIFQSSAGKFHRQ